MAELFLPRSPSPKQHGFALPRRTVLKGSAAAAGAAMLAACGGDDSGETASGGSEGSDADSGSGSGITMGEATGDLTIGSNYSNELPQAGLAAAVAAIPNADIVAMINEVDHNTFQENISTYLQQPDDIIPWFAGYRMRFFAEQGLLGDISDVWGTIGGEQSDGFKVASTGDDGNQYFVPWNYYAWGVHYRKSFFDEMGWEPPTDLDSLTALAGEMTDAGITPFAFGNDGQWPAMGTFDQINFRLNGYQFHVDLMAGKESWEDDRVKDTFSTFGTLAAFHQENPNGRTWEDAAAALVNNEAGMYTIGNFVGSQFPEEELDDVDFFPFPELNSEFGTGTVEAPIDGWMMAKSPGNEAAAKEMLAWFGQGAAQDAYLAEDPSVVATSSSADTSVYNELQKKAQATVAEAEFVTQFLDRDTSPEFASNVAGPAIADFLSDPSKIDEILASVEEQAGVILRDE